MFISGHFFSFGGIGTATIEVEGNVTLGFRPNFTWVVSSNTFFEGRSPRRECDT